MTMSATLSDDWETLEKGHVMILPTQTSEQAVLFFNGAPSEILPRNTVVRSLRAVSHAGSQQEMLDSMANYGLFAPNICEHLGGGFTQDNLFDWVGEQKGKENESLGQ